MQLKIITLSNVAGVAYHMLKSGQVKCHINLQNAERYIEELQRAIAEVRQYQIDSAEQAKSSESARHVLPKSRIQLLEEELERLRNAAESLPLPAIAVPPPHIKMPPLPSVTAPSAVPSIFDEEIARANTIVTGGFGG